MANIFISIGSNIEPKRHLNTALTALQHHFTNLCLSSVFESKAVGFTGDNFLNMVVSGDTDLTVGKVVLKLKQIEQNHGRQPNAKKFSSRTLDLDLLLYDDLKVQTPTELPRAELTQNAFVLWPMAEIAPTRIHPGVNQSYQTLWDRYDKSQQQLWPIEFQWDFQISTIKDKHG